MKNNIYDVDYINWQVVDLDTGEMMPRVIAADDETGEYTQFSADNSDEVEFKNGNIKLINIHSK